MVMYEAKWNNSDECKVACSDMKGALSALLCMTSGNGSVFIYELNGEKPIKVYKIE